MSEPTKAPKPDTPCWTVQQSPTPEPPADTPDLAHLDTPEMDAALAAIIATLHERRPRWMAHAACRHHPHLDWHQATERPTQRTAPNIAAMRTTCATCPVLDQCTAWVHTTPSTDRLPGVVAALTVTERRQQRRTTTTPTPLED